MRDPLKLIASEGDCRLWTAYVTEANTYRRLNGGKRGCRACQAARARRYLQRKREAAA